MVARALGLMVCVRSLLQKVVEGVQWEPIFRLPLQKVVEVVLCEPF